MPFNVAVNCSFRYKDTNLKAIHNWFLCYNQDDLIVPFGIKILI